MSVAVELVELLSSRGETVAVGESLTGGLVCAALVAVPGASLVVRGGVVAYASDLKGALLGVDVALLADVGAVDREVARQMACGVRGRLGATYGVATTGVAGPDPQDGRPPGTVYVAVDGPAGTIDVSLSLDGDRDAVRTAAVDAALDLLSQAAHAEA